MEVLALALRYPPRRCAGAETHLAELLAALTGAGHQVTAVLSEATGDRYRWRGVDVWPADQVDRVVDFVPPADVIVTHLETTPAAAAYGLLNDTPVVVVQHNTFEVGKEALLSARGRVDLVVANSRWVADDLAGWFGSRAGRQPPTIVCRPIPTSMAPVEGPRDRVMLVNCRRRDPDDASGGQLTKGGELFREMAEALPDVGFLGVRGSYGTQQELDDLPNVEVVGPVDHDRMAAEVWARTKLLVAPSSYESWGRAAVEAMTSGVPVVASPTPGLVEAVQVGGIFISPGLVDEWIGTVDRLMANPGEWAEQSARARARAAELADARPGELARWCDAVEMIADREEVHA